MKHSKDKKSLIVSSNCKGSSNCFGSIFQRLSCSGSVVSPTPPDHHHHHHHHHHPNLVSQPGPSSRLQLVDHSGSLGGGQPGVIARLMGLDSMPDCGLPKDSSMTLRSKSLNSLYWYIFPDTFLDHTTPADPFLQSRQLCHRRTQTSLPVLCVESSPLERKVKCKVSEDHGNKRCGNRREIKYGAKLRKKNEVCRSLKGGEWKVKVNEKRTKSGPSTSANKGTDDLARRRRKLSKKIKLDQCRSTDEVRSLSGFEEDKLCKDVRKEREDGLELMCGIRRLTEECVKGDEWVIFDENVKGMGVVFGGQMLQLLIDELVHELLDG